MLESQQAARAAYSDDQTSQRRDQNRPAACTQNGQKEKNKERFKSNEKPQIKTRQAVFSHSQGEPGKRHGQHQQESDLTILEIRIGREISKEDQNRQNGSPR